MDRLSDFKPADEKMPVIAIDFDEVISDDHEAWLKVMLTLEKSGFQVIVVTYRGPNDWPSDLDFLREKGYKVYMTDRMAKRQYCARKGIEPKIWIDDTPESILFDYDNLRGFYTDRFSGRDFCLKVEENTLPDPKSSID